MLWNGAFPFHEDDRRGAGTVSLLSQSSYLGVQGPLQRMEPQQRNFEQVAEQCADSSGRPATQQRPGSLARLRSLSLSHTLPTHPHTALKAYSDCPAPSHTVLKCSAHAVLGPITNIAFCSSCHIPSLLMLLLAGALQS